MSNENTIAPGDYTGEIQDYGISETKGGQPQVFVKFKLLEAGKSLNWFGQVANDQGLEITAKALLTMGFGGTDIAVLAEGKAGNHLNTNEKYSLVVDNREYNGKVYTQISWVNKLGGMASKLDKAGAVQKLAGLNIAGKLVQLRQEMGTENVNAGLNTTGQHYEAQGANDKPPF